jgi:hypothetical protein
MRELVYKGENIAREVVGSGDMMMHVRTCEGKRI